MPIATHFWLLIIIQMAYCYGVTAWQY